MSLISACSPAPMIEEVIQNIPDPEPTETLVESTENEEIIDEPTPTLDVSGWIVKIGELECSLEKFDDEYPRWYKAVCTEDLWLPIGQITPVQIIEGEGNCDLKPAEDFEEIRQEYFPDALQLKFVEMEDGQWGCQVPFSDTAGIKVVCGFRCERDEIGVIVQGKTIRVYRGGGDGSEGGQIIPNPPVCGPAGCDPGDPGIH